MYPAGGSSLLQPAGGSIGVSAAPSSISGNTLPTTGTVSVGTPSGSTTDTSGTSGTSGVGGTGGTAPAPTVSQATIDAIMQSIANSVAQNQGFYNTAAGYNANEDAQAKIDNTHQVQSNTESRGTAVQNAEQAAAQGNQGLRAVLASLGALNGTGQVLAGRAVANSANNDIGGADQTFQNNATAIQNAQTGYDNAAHIRDAALKTALEVDNQNAHATGIQDILNDASNLNDLPTYQKFLPQLVKATAPVQTIAGSTTTYNPATVNSFAPTSGLNVTTAPAKAGATSSSPVNSALFVKKESASKG